MSQKSDCPFDSSRADYDFTEENQDFKEHLHKEFLRAASQGQMTPLSDDDFVGLYAAGDGAPHSSVKKGGNTV